MKTTTKTCGICNNEFQGSNSQRYCKSELCQKILHERSIYYEKYPKEKPIDVTVKVQGEPSWKTISQIAEKVKVGKKERMGRIKKCACGETLGHPSDIWCAQCYALELKGKDLNPTTREYQHISAKPYRF
jgi:hypothetical protein